MFPLRDENPVFHRSVLTFTIIALNAFAWIFVQGLGTEPALSRSVCNLGLIPGELLGAIPQGTRVQIGPQSTCVIGGDPNWLTMLTSMFLHGGWFHLIGNMWFLSVFGDNVEDSMGKTRFIIFYLACGVAATAAQVLSNPDSPVPMIGASGAISGVMGAYAVLYPKAPVHMLIFLGFFVTKVVVPAYILLGYWFLIQILSALPTLGGESGGGVAFWAHAGGFAAGVLLIYLFQDREQVRIHRRIVDEKWSKYQNNFGI